jgi:hypothetical protein
LFFICSGYLYQKLSRVDSVDAWVENIKKKLFVLGIPYVTFSTITWGLKTIFSNSVNNKMNGGLWETLLLKPTAPYWYLYALFFIFLITPTFKTLKGAGAYFVLSVIFKMIRLSLGECYFPLVSYVLSNEVWFMFGVLLHMVGITKIVRRNKRICGVLGIDLGCGFIILSVMICVDEIDFWGMSFLMGILACAATILIMAVVFDGHKQSKIWGFLARYTMPIFLMHTIFAATLRTVLLKMGVVSAVVHVVFGVGVSFAGPIMAAWVMEKNRWLAFFIYPTRFRRLK